MNLFFIVSLCSLGYIIYVYFLWFLKEDKEYKNFNKPFSVIIPAYNENYPELINCVESCLEAKGNKEVILVNNNSNKEETAKAIKYLKRYKDLIILEQPKQGKRFAHSKGLEYSKYDYIVFVDSDTIVSRYAFEELLKPFNNKNIGAVAGQVKVMNKEDNILTRSLSAMFWTSNNIFRRATTSFGYLQVIAGALGAYRKDLLLKLEKDYTSQTFLGRPCYISDDRYITMRIQMRFKKEIEYASKAVAYTYMPTKFKKAWNMIERWKRGVLRETFLIWKEPFWNCKLLMFDVQFNFIFISLMTFLKVVFISNLILNFSLIGLLYTLIWFMIIASMYASIMIVENPKEFPYKLVWTMMYEFVFIFTYVHAWIRIRNQGAWKTR